MGYNHCGLTQSCKNCFISVESIDRWHYKVFPAFPPDLQNLLRLRDYHWHYQHPCFFRLTIRMEIAAGVMPEILEAWPRE